MMRLVGFFAAALVGSLIFSSTAQAESIQVAPLRYDVSLGKGESKKGFVDFVNRDSGKVVLKFSVKGFRQNPQNGNLEFFDDPKLTAAIKLDLESVELDSSEAVHMAFITEGKLLREGDSFAAILASTVPPGTSGAKQSISVGTLLFIQNQTPSPHSLSINSFLANWLQIGDGPELSMAVKNTTDTDKISGFEPDIDFSVWPYSHKTVKGPFVMSGVTRQVTISDKASYFGPALIKVQSGDDTRSQLVFMVTGYWRWLSLVLMTTVVVAFLVIKNRQQIRRAVRRQFD